MALVIFLGVTPQARAQDREPPRSFGDLALGMSFDEAQAALLADPAVDYRGEPDVTLVPVTNRPVIQARGMTFLDRVILQFHDELMYILTVELSGQQFDYYTVFLTLVNRYGEPDRLSPEEAVWESDATIFSLERPLTAKYIDRVTFEALVDGAEAVESLRRLTRERFLERF